MMINRILALTAVGAIGLTAAGCATADAAGAVDPGAATDTYAALVDDIYGTAEQRLADEQRKHTTTQRGIASCMSAAGLDYKIPSLSTSEGGPMDPGDLTSIAPVGLPDLGVGKSREGVARATVTDTPMSRLSGDAEAAYGKALGACVEKAPNDSRWYPDGARELRSQLVAIFRGIEARPAIQEKLADYTSCMVKAGYPASTYGTVRETIQARYPTQETPWAELSKTEAWTKAVAYEKAATAADTTCRTDLHDTVMVLGAGDVQALVDNSADVLASIRRQRAERAALPVLGQ